MKKKHCYITFLTSLSLIGCTTDSDIDSNKKLHIGDSDYQKIVRMLNEADLGSKTRTTCQPLIKSIKNKSYAVKNNSVTECDVQTETRSKDNTIFTISCVEFTTDGTDRYAFLSTDDRLESIYFIADSGELTDTANNEILNDYINSIPNIAAYELINNTTINPEIVQEIPIPIVKYNWGQGFPYNSQLMYCGGPYCNNLENKGYPNIGCTTVAVAQALATIDVLPYWWNIKIDKFKYNTDDFTEDQFDEIGRYMKMIADGCNVRINCKDQDRNSNGSGGILHDVKSFLISLNYEVEYSLKTIDSEKLRKELIKGYPHILSGINKTNPELGGHAWIIDGLKTTKNGYIYHCSWGWNGNSNGWVKGVPYNINGVSYEKEPVNLYILKASGYSSPAI